MTLLNVAQQLPDRDKIQGRSALGKLARAIAPKKPPTPVLGLRRGDVSSISLVIPGQVPTYTVDVAGVSVTATCISTCGPLVGDTVMILRQGPDWMILGLAPLSAGMKSWGPLLIASTTNPTVSASVGYFRMVGPTSMWFSFDISTTAIGSGTYSITGLPLSAQFDAVIPMVYATSGTARYPVIGQIFTSTNNREILRIATHAGGLGVSSTSPAGASAQRFIGQAVIEVDPSGL